MNNPVMPEVHLTVEKFHPLREGARKPHTTASVGVDTSTKYPKIKYRTPAQTRTRDGVLRFRQPGPFKILVHSKDPNKTYQVLGIEFRKQSDPPAAHASQNGSELFVPMYNSLEIFNKWDERDRRVRYKYYLTVRCAETGEIGIIDPDIENEE